MPPAEPAPGRVRRLLGSAYTITIANTVATAILGFLAYSIVGRVGSTHDVIDYTTARRLVSFAAPIAALGYGVTMPVYIAQNSDRQRGITALLGEQLICTMTLSILAAAVATIWRGPVEAALRLSLPEILAALLLVASLTYTAMIFAYLRGFQRFGLGAALNVVTNGAAVVIAAFAIASHLWVVLVLWATINVVAGRLVARAGNVRVRVRVRSRRFILRSASRVPGDAAFAGLFLLPVYLLPASVDPTSRAVYNYSFVILGLMVAAAAPVAIVMLPRVAATSGDQHSPALAYRLLAVSLFVGISSGLVMRFLATPFVELALGPGYASGSQVVAGLWLAPIGLSMYALCRTLLDGWSSLPLSPMIALLGLVVLVLTGRDQDLYGVLAAVNVSFSIIGTAVALTIGLLLMRKEQR